MKKLLSITLACLMVLTFAVSVSAEDNIPEDPSVNVSVEANEADPVTDVTVGWDSVDFTYVFNRTWNPESHEDDVEKGWKTSGNATLEATKSADFTIENNSNKSVTVAAEYVASTLEDDDATQFANVNVTLSTLSKSTLAAATTSAVDRATATLTITGEPTEADRASFVIGTINITVS